MTHCCAGLSIIDFESATSAIFISQGATVTLQNSTLTRNTITGSFLNVAIISVNAVDPNDNNVPQDTILRLRQCTLAGNTATNVLTATADSEPFELFGVGVYSDVEREVFLNGAIPLRGNTLGLEEAPGGRPGIDESSVWFVDLQQVRFPLKISLFLE